MRQLASCPWPGTRHRQHLRGTQRQTSHASTQAVPFARTYARAAQLGVLGAYRAHAVRVDARALPKKGGVRTCVRSCRVLIIGGGARAARARSTRHPHRGPRVWQWAARPRGDGTRRYHQDGPQVLDFCVGRHPGCRESGESPLSRTKVLLTTKQKTKMIFVHERTSKYIVRGANRGQAQSSPRRA